MTPANENVTVADSEVITFTQSLVLQMENHEYLMGLCTKK